MIAGHRRIQVFVHGKPPGVDPDVDLNMVSTVKTPSGTFHKLNVGWVEHEDSSDGEIVSRFSFSGRLPEGVSLAYRYDTDPQDG